ncbi:MAG: F0F1 ATP synthase subunit B [Desulfobacteraceae bacterium]|nr:F0F1 ATP synthase subunit B [Desulfobacteraceae bacterium]
MKKNEQQKKQLCAVSLIAVFVLILGSAAWASSDGDGGVHNAWLDIDTWKVLNFGVLVTVLFFLVKKPVAEFFSSRSKGIEQELADLEQKKADAAKNLADYQAKFQNLDEESKQIVENYIKQGEEAKQRILEEAEAQAEKLEDLAKRNIEQEFKAAKAKLQEDIVEMAMEKAESVVKDAITPEDQEKLVDDYLKKVVA